jgi:hypothetical protein
VLETDWRPGVERCGGVAVHAQVAKYRTDVFDDPDWEEIP